MTENTVPGITKRDLLALKESGAGGTAMYMAMGAIDQAKASSFKPIKLEACRRSAR
jgi:hypothetical protein